MSTLTANKSIVSQFNNSILNAMKTTKIHRERNNYISASIQFSADEIGQMSEPFKWIFKRAVYKSYRNSKYSIILLIERR